MKDMRTIPLGTLKKGDRFVATKPSAFNGVIVRAGVADMDGHLVSEDYGFRMGNNHYLNPKENYTNVKFDGETYGPNWKHPNDSLNERDGWTVWVTADIRLRVDNDVLYNADLQNNLITKIREEKQEQDRAAKKLELLSQIAKLKREVEGL